MEPERWHRVERLYHSALKIETDQRAVFLKAECQDDEEVRKEVESLLSHEKSAAEFIESPAFDLAAKLIAEDDSAEPVTSPEMTGAVLPRFRVLEKIGSGGMGLVYRAEDLKLGRKVALKFLPEHSAKEPAALGRFEREARAASALEHPNICPIYEFGEHQGRPFLVMQLLEGQTLRELIAAASPGKPPLGIEKLLDLAIQIVGGLDAAHHKGIIHRDIKPANIFVTSQGQAKILDFGLAKLTSAVTLTQAVTVVEDDAERDKRNRDPDETLDGSSPLATPDAFLSRTGVMMGTAGYMSPEQARGEKLDARTDLFSFGLVLHEMATGQRAFKGDTWPVLRDAILKSTPASLSQWKSELPAKLGKIINKALEKDRDARYQSAAEILADLQSLKQATEHRSRRRELAAVGVALLLIASAITWRFQRRQPSPQARPEPKLTQLTFNSSENRVLSGAISPDGSYLAYSEINGMYVKLLKTGAIRAVPQPEGFSDKKVQWEVAAWFPDSARFLANAHPADQDPRLWGSSADTNIWAVSIAEGAPHKLRDNAAVYSVSPDGSLISFGTNVGKAGDREIWLMTPSGEQAHMLFQADEKSSVCCLAFFPGGQRVSYSLSDQSGASILARDLAGGPVVTLLPPSEGNEIDNLYPWLPDGRLLYSVRKPSEFFFTRNLLVMRLDPYTGKITEKPRSLTNWIGSSMDNATWTADGKRLAFVKQEMHQTSYMVDLAGATHLLNVRRFPLSESAFAAAVWTPDSKQVIDLSTRPGDVRLYKQRLDEETIEPLVAEGYGRNPVVTPDGKWVLYMGVGDAGTPLENRAQPVMRVSINGGVPQALFTAKPLSIIMCAKAASKLCAIAEPSEDRKQAIIATLDQLKGRGPELARFAIDPNDNRWYLDLSPDGTRLAATRTPAGPVYILSAHGQPIAQIKVKGWTNLQEFSWAANGKGLYVSTDFRDGKALLYLNLRGNARVVWENLGAVSETNAYPSPDGRHLLISTYTRNDNMWMMENF